MGLGAEHRLVDPDVLTHVELQRHEGGSLHRGTVHFPIPHHRVYVAGSGKSPFHFDGQIQGDALTHHGVVHISAPDAV